MGVDRQRTFAEVFPMIGFLLAFLAVPALLSWVAQIRFARRFERLVKQGRVLPVFIRDQGLNEGQDMITVANGAGDVYSIPIKNGRRTKVSMKSFLEAWVDVRYHFNDAKYWKPITAVHISPQSGDHTKEDILSSVKSKESKKEAAVFLKSIRYRRRYQGQPQSQSQSHPRTQSISDSQDHDEVDPKIDPGLSSTSNPNSHPNPEEKNRISGRMQYATLICMPSLSHPQFQGTQWTQRNSGTIRTVGVQKTKAERRTTNPSSLTSSRISSEVRTPFQGVQDVQDAQRNEKYNGRDGSAGNTYDPISLPLVEIGVAEELYDIDRETFDQLVGAGDGDGDGSESITSVERDSYPPVFVARPYPITYGTRSHIVVRQGHARQTMGPSPLLANTRTRLF